MTKYIVIKKITQITYEIYPSTEADSERDTISTSLAQKPVASSIERSVEIIITKENGG